MHLCDAYIKDFNNIWLPFMQEQRTVSLKTFFPATVLIAVNCSKMSLVTIFFKMLLIFVLIVPFLIMDFHISNFYRKNEENILFVNNSIDYE